MDALHFPIDDPRTAVPRVKRRARLLVATAALVGLALAASACSSDPSTPGVAGADSGSPRTTSGSASNQGVSTPTPAQAAAALAYSECMRSHGVPNFPDPNSNGMIQIQGGSNSSNGLDPNSPAFQTASKDCQSKQPQPTKSQQAQALANALKQAQCMRNHGIKDFPDPQSSGGRITMKIQGGAGSDLNPDDPLFQQAQAACMPGAPIAKGSGNTTSGGGNVISQGVAG
jgi:hypothetical protein